MKPIYTGMQAHEVGEDNHLMMVRCETVEIVEKHWEGEVIGQLIIAHPASHPSKHFEPILFYLNNTRLKLCLATATHNLK